MKKKKIFLILILVSVFSFMSPVFAKEDLFIEKINEVTVENNGFWRTPFANSYKTSTGGYVVAQENYVYYLDKNNNIIWRYYVGNLNGAYDILLDGDYVYVTIGKECRVEAGKRIETEDGVQDSEKPEMPREEVSHKGDNKTDEVASPLYKTVKLKLSNGSVVKTNSNIYGVRIEKVGNYYAIVSYDSIVLMDANLNYVNDVSTGYCIAGMTVRDNLISVINTDNKIIVFDQSLNSVSTKNITNFDWLVSTKDAKTFLTDGTNHYTVNFGVYKFDASGRFSELLSSEYDAATEVDSLGYFAGDIIGGYFFIAGTDYRGETPTVFVNVYDKDFNYLQSINVGSDTNNITVKNLYKTSSGFTVKWVTGSDDTLHVSDYSVKFNITTEVQGEGTVDVIGSAFAGEAVSFKVTPKKGYLVLRVTITDADGNSVVYEDVDSDYVFTMPNSDAKVTVQFAKNPLTSSGVWYTLLGLGVLGGVTYFFRKKKVNN